MKLYCIGKHIRKYRLERKMRQEDLAEKTELSVNYIGMLERGEKIPALETLVNIANALKVSADMLLVDVIESGYEVKNSLLNEKLMQVIPEDREKIYAVIDTMLKHSRKTLKK